jgi:transposase
VRPAPLEIPGCGVLSAAMIVGETARVSRFRSRDAYARFTGTAPVPAWSGNTLRVRLNRGGNRSVNCALRMIAVTQTRGAGKTRTEAPRLLRRQLSDAAFRALRADEHRRQTTDDAHLPAAA